MRSQNNEVYIRIAVKHNFELRRVFGCLIWLMVRSH